MNINRAISRLKGLVGKDLYELASNFDITVHKDGKVNKGWPGLTLERFLGLEQNTRREPDFVTWELKSVPLKYLKNGNLTVKETMAISMINEDDVIANDFEHSNLYNRLKKTVVVFRITGKNFDRSNIVHSVVKFNLAGDLYFKVKTDYDTIRNILLTDGYNGLHSEQGIYIQPRTKGAGHGSKTRAFYARKGFIKLLINL